MALPSLGRWADIAAINILEKTKSFLADIMSKLDLHRGIDGSGDACSSLMELGKYARAAKCYDKIIKRDPVNTQAWINKGNSLLSLRNYDEAIK